MSDRVKTETKASESKTSVFSAKNQKHNPFILKYPETEPIFALQRMIGNQAVQRLSASVIRHPRSKTSGPVFPQAQAAVAPYIARLAASRSLEHRPALRQPPCACLVFVHNDEQNARQAAETLHTYCRYNLAVIGPGRSRRIHIPGSGARDPNELFPADVQEECTRDESACREYIDAHDNLRAAQMQFFLAIRDCAQGFALPVIALHNNSIADTERYRQAVPAMGHRIAVLMEDIDRATPSGRGSREDLRSRLAGLREETGRRLMGIMNARNTTNIFRWCNLPEISRCHIGDPFHPDFVIWVTNRADFETLSRSNVNVVLQEGSTTGSESDTDLSTLFTRLGPEARFINIETPISPQDEATRTDNMIFILENLQRLGLNCCEPERRDASGTESRPMQRKPLSEETPYASHNIDQSIRRMQGAGQPLPDCAREYFEPRFNVDFNEVRIHSDDRADQVARRVNARAFTYGRDLFFQSQAYDPLSGAGRHLLAHELAHVVQQGAAAPAKPSPAAAALPETVQRSGPRGLRGQSGEARGVDLTGCMSYIAREVAQESPPASQAGAAAQGAAAEMENMRISQNILLDFWAGDCRDNDKNNRCDANDPVSEGPGTWAQHIGDTRPGFMTIGSHICQGGEGGQATMRDFNTDQTVMYSVCAKVVSQAYRAAGIPVPDTAGTGALVHWFQAGGRLRRFWRWGHLPGPCLPGDFICSYGGGGGHSGMVVEASTGTPMVVHLAGTSEHINRGIYDPTRLSDMAREIWPEQNRTIFGIGRYLG